MDILDRTISEAHGWAKERIHILCERGEVESIPSLKDDAFSIFKEFEEWYDENIEDHEVYSLEYIGEDSEFS